MLRKILLVTGAALAGMILLASGALSSAQSTATAPAVPSATAQSGQSTSSNTSTAATSSAKARRRAARRRQRANQQQTPSNSAQVGPTAAQRSRDAQILAAQKAQSAAIANENDALTQKVVRDQQQQQAEPRIQDAPGVGSQPLPGDPAIQPVQPSDPPRVQDAPGPSQTLPKAPPATPAPQS